ncbi:hypothetical protein PRZ48_007306 [Zasmidium cellare]|uniref:Uncharacterized protein n=1 Tax=Zasmidium cellare TaxID=395010 RepID=A0ABR0EIZ9_ZASCE|nr:hypothetical protein PRZ48_007306 [Zasmidium cellare]
MHLIKPTTFALLATGTAAQNASSSSSSGGYMCPIKTSTADMTALEYGWVFQDFLYKYYMANGEFSASDFAKMPMSDMKASNGMTKAQNLATNMNGLTTQAKLAVQGLQDLGAPEMQCNYSYPPSVAEDPMAFVVAVAYVEATLCGTFIGLADYVQNPTSAFLMARIAAEHGIHGSFLRSLMDPVPYSQNSTMLTPAFTPMEVLQPSNDEAVRDNVGNLGAFIPQSYVTVPNAPCSGEVTIGKVNAKLSNAGTSSSMASSQGSSATQSGYASPTSGMMGSGSSMGDGSNSSSVQQYTGAGSKGGFSTVLLGAIGVVAGLLA